MKKGREEAQEELIIVPSLRVLVIEKTEKTTEDEVILTERATPHKTLLGLEDKKQNKMLTPHLHV